MGFLDFLSTKRKAYSADDREFFSIIVFAYISYVVSIAETTLSFLKEELSKDPSKANSLLSFTYMKGAAMLDVFILAKKTVSIIEKEYNLRILNSYPEFTTSIEEIQYMLDEIGEDISNVSCIDALSRIDLYFKTMIRIYDRKEQLYSCSRAITENEVQRH